MSKKFFPGWRMVICCMLMLGVTHGICNNCYSLFLIPVTTSLGVTRQSFSLIQTIFNMIYMAVSLLCGRVYRKIPVMTTMRVAAVLLPVSYGMCGVCNSIGAFYACAVVYSVCMGFLTFLPATKIISGWFEEKRGLAIGLAFMGSGLGGMLFSALGGVWIEQFGWRRVFFIYALIIAAVALPIVFFFLKERPDGVAPLGSAGKPEKLYGPNFASAVRMPRFAALLVITAVIGIVTAVQCGIMVPHITDLGFDATYAALLYAAYQGALAAVKVLMGLISDRLGAKRAGWIAMAGCGLSCLFLLLAANIVFHVPAVITVAVGAASSTVLYPLLTRYCFGNMAYFSLYGCISAVNSLTTSASYILQNAVYDATGSYSAVFIACIGLSLLGMAMLPILKKTKKEE